MARSNTLSPASTMLLQITVGDITQAITDMGYDACVAHDDEAGTVTVAIGGMTCASCVAAIETALARERGILSVRSTP